MRPLKKGQRLGEYTGEARRYDLWCQEIEAPLRMEFVFQRSTIDICILWISTSFDFGIFAVWAASVLVQIALTSGKARKVALRGKSDASPFIIEELYAAWAGPWAGWEESRLTTEDFENAREWNELDLMECCDTFFLDHLLVQSSVVLYLAVLKTLHRGRYWDRRRSCDRRFRQGQCNELLGMITKTVVSL